MMEVMSCWKIDWTAISAVATAGAAIVALWVGLEPRRLEIKQQKQRAATAAGLLMLELQAALVTGIKLQEEKERQALCRFVGTQIWALETMDVPLLKACITSADTYPTKVSLLMGSACATTSALKSSINAMQRTMALTKEQSSRMQIMAQAVESTCTALHNELQSYLPATNRSISDTQKQPVNRSTEK